ncbi:type 1 glutamine amidotransferase [Streptomyces sp. NPDC090025]|uniref:type 1 glutamine amidotransferase n=1 Tax=Streptomyces sp. NPDC090025 TaxID=3365922 RepID=UPI0038394CCB
MPIPVTGTETDSVAETASVGKAVDESGGESGGEGAASPGPVLVIQQEDGAGPGIVGERLRAAGFALRVLHPWRGEELPGTLDGMAGLLVLGGAANCEDDAAAPWLAGVRTLIREAVHGRTALPLLGICLGGQLMAQTLGGRVVRRPQGPELGVTPVRRLPAVAADRVFASVPEGAAAAQWHWDEIGALPPGAVPLLGGDDCPYQAFRIGDVAWGTQFHPEVLSDTVALWAATDAEQVRADGLDPDDAIEAVRTREPRLRDVWGTVADAWADVVRQAHARVPAPAAPAEG